MRKIGILFSTLSKKSINLRPRNVIEIHPINVIKESDIIISAGNHKLINKDFILNNNIINFHAAPLPKYGGSAGPAFALLNNDTKFGCTFQKMEESLDAGEIISRYYFEIKSDLI